MAEANTSSAHPPLPPTEEEDRLAWLRLLRSRRVGIATFWRLLAEHGSAIAALAALPAIARAAGETDYQPCPAGVARAEMQAAARAGARLVLRGDPAYPSGLEDLPDPPPLLWLRGRADLLARPMIALVGARNASSLGLRMARGLAGDLSAAGFAVVSGLARGIDTAAHEAALRGGTVAAMAGGVDVVYPPENAPLAARLAAEGALLSEMPMGLTPQARHFPARNRIVAGLCRAVVVVEAAAKSGSLITARSALDLGREVMAVPGHPCDARAGGCNMLIRDGAILVRDAADVIELLGRPDPAPPPATVPDPEPPARTAGPFQLPDLARLVPRLRRGTGGVSAPDRPPLAAPAPVARAEPAQAPAAAPAAPWPQHTVAALHGAILARLGPSPLAEDQLIRDLALPPQAVLPALVDLELDGRIARAAGGLLARTDG